VCEVDGAGDCSNGVGDGLGVCDAFDEWASASGDFEDALTFFGAIVVFSGMFGGRGIKGGSDSDATRNPPRLRHLVVGRFC
jgi:hypothetical protein